jgi:uncharacterized membrane protein (Fun14 family)
MEEMLTPIALLLIIGGVSGYFVGQIMKRLRGKAFLIGILIFITIALTYMGIVDVDLGSINATLTEFLSYIAALGIIAIVSSVPFATSFVAGIFIGYIRY